MHPISALFSLNRASVCCLVLFEMLFYLVHIAAALQEVFLYLVRTYILRIPVSYPGDAIKNTQSRTGQWPDRNFRISGTWKFAVDDASHAISEQQTPGVLLTGESAGRQIWYQDGEAGVAGEPTHDVVFNADRNPNGSDLLLRNILIGNWKGTRPDATSKPATAKEAARKGMEFFQMLQMEDGHWAGDYGGPLFLLPGLICTLYLTKVPYPAGRREGMIVYLKNHQQVDGGWGSHIECASTLFGTVLSYVALRLLGEAADAPYMCHAREFLHAHGGALYAPSWAKFWLAVIGVYAWEGINSIPAEMWILPKWVPLHPSQFWCHCRMIYLPMCYLYCKRYTPDVSQDPLLQALRREIYRPEDGAYERIDWEAHRQSCASIDEYTPLNPVIKVAQDALMLYERILPYMPLLRMFREYALKFVIEYIHAEDLQTNYICIGPVSKCLNMLSVYDACGAKSVAFQRHIARVDDYIWVAEDGVKMQGYNGSQCWDTSFTVRAMVEAGLAEQFPECSRKIYSYLKRSQIAKNEENMERYNRHPSKGGWPFSTAAHGWPISDCTSEALKAVLALHKHDVVSDTPLLTAAERISDARLCDAADVLLSYQNADGGWASYENNRGYRWYELFNPSSVFGDIMIDYSYVECSSASIAALKEFAEALPGYRTAEVLHAITTGREFLKSIQRPDGSWYGSWGNCFTYGTWFGIEGLICAGESADSPQVRGAVAFLLSKQRANGGWGEGYLACINKAYPDEGTGEHLGDGGSGVVQTAWALLGLLAGGCTDQQALDRARDFLMRKQLPSGDWAQENITGIFARSSGITYTAYRNLFPLWALARVAAYCVNESSVVWIDEYQPSIIGTFVNCLIYAQDAMIAPYYTTGQQINVSTELFLNNLIKVDEVTSTVTLDFFFLTYWTDDRLLMPALWAALPNPQVYQYGVDVSEADGLTNVQGVQPAMWLPDIVFADAVEITKTQEYLKLYPSGQIRRMQHYVMTFSQGRMNYEDYPCDTQNISISFFSFTLTSGQLIFKPVGPQDDHQNNPPVDLFYPVGSTTPAFADNPVWSLVDTGYDFVSWQLSSGFLMRPFGVVTFTIARKSRGIIMRLCMPVLLIMLLCALSYWGTVSDRIATTVTGLLAIAALYIAVIGAIPLVGYMTRLDKFMFTMFVVIFVNTMVHMCVVRLNTKEKGANWPLRKLAVRILEFCGRVAMIPWIIITYLVCFLPTVRVALVVFVSLVLVSFEVMLFTRYVPELRLTFETTKQLVLEKKRNGKGKNSKLSSLEIRFLRYCHSSDEQSGTNAARSGAAAEGGVTDNGAAVEIEMQRSVTSGGSKKHATMRATRNSRGARDSNSDNNSDSSATGNPLTMGDIYPHQ